MFYEFGKEMFLNSVKDDEKFVKLAELWAFMRNKPQHTQARQDIFNMVMNTTGQGSGASYLLLQIIGDDAEMRLKIFEKFPEFASVSRTIHYLISKTPDLKSIRQEVLNFFESLAEISDDAFGKILFSHKILRACSFDEVLVKSVFKVIMDRDLELFGINLILEFSRQFSSEQNEELKLKIRESLCNLKDFGDKLYKFYKNGSFSCESLLEFDPQLLPILENVVKNAVIFSFSPSSKSSSNSAPLVVEALERIDPRVSVPAFISVIMSSYDKQSLPWNLNEKFLSFMQKNRVFFGMEVMINLLSVRREYSKNARENYFKQELELFERIFAVVVASSAYDNKDNWPVIKTVLMEFLDMYCKEEFNGDDSLMEKIRMDTRFLSLLSDEESEKYLFKLMMKEVNKSQKLKLENENKSKEALNKTNVAIPKV